MFCSKCGTEIKPGQSFCPKCGHPVTKKEAEAPAPEPVSVPEPTPAIEPTPAPAAQPPKKKSKVGLIIGVAAAAAVLLIGGIVLALRAGNDTGSSSQRDRDRDREEERDERSAGAKKDAVRTVMIYFVGSDLESGSTGGPGGFASNDIDEILAADIPDNVNVVLECGGTLEWQNEDIPDGEVTRFVVDDGELIKVEELGETTMTKTGDLTDFITFCMENYPADNYTLDLWDHGGGIPVGFGCDELGDYEDMMTDYEIRDELSAAGVTLDAVIFDACNVCTLEMAEALKDYASYMVGAESYVNGVGMYYTDWLSMTDGDCMSFCEKIADDYINYIHENDMVGTMSVIRLDKIDNVYNAYIDYLESVDSAIASGDYAGYVKARSNCGGFQTTDFVDLLTLVTNYNTGKSTPVINSIIGAIEYTSSDEASDFTAGHGIVVYCPRGASMSGGNDFWGGDDYDALASFYYYEDGRKSFTNLGYDQRILDFYDGYMSRNLAYQGDAMVAQYGGTWYGGDYSAEVAAAGGPASEYTLTPVLTDNYYALQLTDEDWEALNQVCLSVMVDNQDGTYLLLGMDYTGQSDSEGNLCLVDPENWTYVNGDLACYFAVDYTNGEDSWSQTGAIPVTVNGRNAYMAVQYDQDYPSGRVLGYCTVDDNWDESDDYMFEFEDSDQIDLVYIGLNDNGDTLYEANGSPFSYADLFLDYDTINLDESATYGGYTLYDVYGNMYETDDYYPLGSIHSVSMERGKAENEQG
ncbi:MAG: zinc-ribbon domain-containing protein [Lachnospiraceae bacterium]|nr:zinc-ribbon domain-containing protein [Lachnospiraceae bacterium]